jgi:hypothetical protein
VDRDELRDFRRLKREAGNSLFVFETERGGPLSATACSESSKRRARQGGSMSRLILTCCGMRPAIS